jgi:GT2 family glycosyltransferase
VSVEDPLGSDRHVTVVVVTHRGRGEVLRRCVGALARAGGHHALVVVDNSDARGAGGLAAVRPESYGCGVDGVVTMPNRGYGAAANRGIDWAVAHAPADRPRAVALLNDDTEVDVGWLAPLVAALDHDERVGAAQPKLLLVDGERVNSVGVTLDAAFAGSDIGFGEPDGPAWHTARDIDVFTGGAVLLRAELILDTAGFDERYFLYYEDVDLALRGAEHGWRYRCEPRSVVRHRFGDTTRELGAERARLLERNRLRAAARHADPATLARAFWLAARRVRHEPRRAHARGLLGGLAVAPTTSIERLVARRTTGRRWSGPT